MTDQILSMKERTQSRGRASMILGKWRLTATFRKASIVNTRNVKLRTPAQWNLAAAPHPASHVPSSEDNAELEDLVVSFGMSAGDENRISKKKPYHYHWTKTQAS